MGKRIFAALLALAVLLPAAAVSVRAAPEISAPSAILVEASTGQVLFESNSRERLAPASVTKIMTLLLVMEALQSGVISMNDTVTASASACAKGGSQVYLEEGEQMTMDEMLKSVVVSSANDCACALAEHIAGSESAFVEKMNRRAQELGMEDTHFVNCTGLDDDPEAKAHLTSARDIAIMSRELLKHDQIRKYTTIWMDTVRNGQFGLTNTNKLVRFYDGATGLKTGYTSAAGHCLSASAVRDGMELIAVVLHCASSTDRFESAKALLNYGFANYALVRPEEGQNHRIPVKLGKDAEVEAVTAEPVELLINKDQRGSVTFRVELEESVTAPVSRGQRLGTLTVMAGEQILAQYPLVAARSVEGLSFWELFSRVFGRLVMSPATEKMSS